MRPRQYAMAVWKGLPMDKVPEEFRAWVGIYLEQLKRAHRPKLLVRKQPYA